jgi:hypothetical protein
MRKFIILLGVAGLSVPSLGSESAQNPLLKKPAGSLEQPRETRRCAKKIVLGGDKNVVACLMRKRNVLTEPEADHRASGSARDEPAKKRRAASPPSSK